MKKLLFWAIVLTTTIWIAFGCSDDNPGASGSDADGDSDSDADGDSDGDSDSDSDTDGSVCGEVNADLTAVSSRVMILEDKSLSMDDNNKWDYAVAAIEQMVTTFDSNIEFGLDLFSRSTTTNQGGGDMCTVGDSIIHDVALNNGQTIINELQGWEPSAATPLLLAMGNYVNADYAPEFLDGSGGSYLVIISDGADTCGSNGEFDQNNGASAEELATVTTNLLEAYGIRTIVIGFGDGVEPDQLNAIAEAGGTQFDEYLVAEDGDSLTAALNTIGETVMVNCEFQVGTFDQEVDYDQVTVTFDGLRVQQDEGCTAGIGWMWTSDARTAIQFCDAACTALESGDVQEVNIRILCPGETIEDYEVEPE